MSGSMSCYGCSKKYGLFSKEYGCPNCGYSYCVKCLKRPAAVPRQGGKVLNVCLICYDKLSKEGGDFKVIDCDALPGTIVTRAPPRAPGAKSAAATNAEAADALFDDAPAVVNLDAPLAPMTTTSNAAAESSADSAAGATHSKRSEIDENLDSVLSKRLQDLKTVETTDDDLRARLANLSGMPHQKNYDRKDLLLSTDQRTDQERIKDLLEQFLGESALDQRIERQRTDDISDIERRLRALRDTTIDDDADDGAAEARSKTPTYSPDTNTPSDNEYEENDESVLRKIMEKYSAEAKLPAGPTELEAELANSMPLPPGDSNTADTEELPWCTICNEDAVYRCNGCDGELYCNLCYCEVHDNDEEYRTHVKVKFTAPPKFKENHF